MYRLYGRNQHMEMQCKKTAEFFTKTRKKFAPFPKASERAAYEALSPALRERVIKEGENFLGYEYPAIRATNFMHFTRTGDRISFESLYFARRHALCGLAAAEDGADFWTISSMAFLPCVKKAHGSFRRTSRLYRLPFGK